MRINPINYNISTLPYLIYSKSCFYFPPKSTDNDRFELTFTAFEDSPKVNLENGLNISGIHCPSCGVKMLSPDDYEKLIARAGKIKRVDELVELLNDYKRYIPTYMRGIIKDTLSEKDYSDLGVFEFHKLKGYQAYNKRRNRIKESKNFLKEYSKNFPLEKQKIIEKTIENINTNDNYKTYKDKIITLSNDLNLDRNEKAYLSNKILRNVATSELYYNIFYLGHPNELGVSSLSELPAGYIAQSLIKNIFLNVTSHISYVDKHPSYIDNPNNSILLCRSCNVQNKEKMMFWKTYSLPYAKDNIKMYLGDIAKLMGQGEIDKSDDYIRYVCYVSDVASGHKVHFDNQEILGLRSVLFLSGRHDAFEPIEQSKVDIPCACCGSIMLPHSVRLEIEDDMKKCSTPLEYAQVIKKYEKYIGKYTKDSARIFLEIIEKNPNISEEQFLQKFKKKMDNYLSVGTRLAIDKYMNKRSYYASNASKDILEMFDITAKRVKDYVNSGKFKDYEYTKMYQECFGDLYISNTGQKALYVLCTDLKEVAYKYGLIKEIETDSLDKDKIYSIVFKLFKFDVATADHLVAASKEGHKSSDNLIGLCKGCNSIVKANKSVHSWFSQNYYVRFNLRKQLHTINNMAKEGLIDGYDDWAKNMADKMYELTGHKYDIRDEFK